MDVVQYFLEQHAWCHRAIVSGHREATTIDRLLDGLSDAELRERPATSLNSIAWIIWHMARIEDVTMTLFSAEQPQVIETDDWPDRLRAGGHDIGTGMDDAEVGSLSEGFDRSALIEYRDAVGLQTRRFAETLSPGDLDHLVSTERVLRLQRDGVIRDAAGYLVPAWQGRTLGFVMRMPASGHSFVHIGEAWCVRSLVGAGGGR